VRTVGALLETQPQAERDFVDPPTGKIGELNDAELPTGAGLSLPVARYSA
jgi:hypothetical protein